ncbi:MAG TPA: hypothetical protein K8V00_06545 [Ligilactobacillus acidipiscis]|uniref:Uncharacterized protein n=1 Tax=Ligilactobacillus acidipiscis TaxID=89059 RepID=A0A921F9S0_9LACO|nr:hypothetical protein [Ligilactobacillus acidipiscis]
MADKIKGNSVRIHPEAYEIFRKIAFDDRKSMSDIVDEAAQALIEKRNK